jgi:hypothetical protein
MGRKLNGCRSVPNLHRYRSVPNCACGAVASEMAGMCEKCRFRARWLRRKVRHSFGAR